VKLRSSHATLSSAEAPYERFVSLGGRAESDGKRERAGASLPRNRVPKCDVTKIKISEIMGFTEF